MIKIEVIIPVTGGRTGSKEVKMKALYTDTHVYFIAQWNDETEDLIRMPWKFDGKKWERLPGGGAYYEDKFSIYWKAARTGPVNQVDDQYVNWLKKGELKPNGEPSKEAGRHGDPKTGGGYIENIDKEKNLPIYMLKDPGHPLVHKDIIMKEEASLTRFSISRRILPGTFQCLLTTQRKKPRLEM